MTLDEAKKWVDRARGIAPEFRNATESALIALDDALRAAESQVERLNANQVAYDVRCPTCLSSMVRDTTQSGGAEAMRAAAAKAVRQAFTEAADSRTPMPSLLTFTNVVAARIERLPVPPARTSEPAAPTPGPTARCYLCGSNECIGFLHTTNGRNDYCAAHDPSAPKPGPTTPAAKFDAEAALVAFAEGLTHPTLPEAIHAPGQEIHAIREALFRGLAAGRRGAR